MRRIELLNISNNSKIILLLSAIECFTKLPPKEGSQMFSGGTKIVLNSGTVVHVRDFYSVVDFLIAEASRLEADTDIAHGYFAGEDEDADERYALFKTLSNRDVQTPKEEEAQESDEKAPAIF